MINKLKNIFKSNNSKDADIAKPKNRDIDIDKALAVDDELGTQIEQLLQKAEKQLDDKVDVDFGDNADDIMVMDYDMSKEYKEKAKVKKPKIEIVTHAVHSFPGGIKKDTIPMSAYSLEELITSTVKQFAPIIVKKGIRLELDGLDISIKTNKEVMLFILQEVISNAINHTVAGELKIYMLNNELLVIEDNGMGIPAAELSQVFNEGFVGSKSPNKDKAEGIGLFKAAIALEKMGYPYEVQSGEGFGTGFAIKVK